MRITHVITRLLRAGSEENTLLTCAGQIAAGHDVALLHGRVSNTEYALRMAPSVRLLEIPALERELSATKDMRAFWQLRDAYRTLQPDVVHTHQSKAGIIGRLAASASGLPAIVHGVHILPFLEVNGAKKAVYLNAERLVARKTDAFIHVSEGMMASCFAHRVGTRKLHRLVYSGFNVDRFARAEPPADWRELLRVEPEAAKPPVVVMLAALEERKQHLGLIDRFPDILQEQPEARLLLAGEGDLRGGIEERIRGLGLEDRVRLLGYRSDPERIIAMADVCVLSSRREGLPRSVLQYLAGGRPAVMFHVEGIEHLVQNGRNGIVVGQGDWGGLTASILELLSGVKRRETMAGDARGTDLSRWDASQMAGRTLAVYDEILLADRAAAHRDA